MTLNVYSIKLKRQVLKIRTGLKVPSLALLFTSKSLDTQDVCTGRNFKEF